MTLKGSLIGVAVVSVLLYFLDWGFYMLIMPVPEEMMEQLGALMYNEETMPNPVWYLLMEFAGAGLLAFAVLQKELSTMQVFQRGVIVFTCIVAAIDVSWGMSLNVTYPMSGLFIELAYKAIGGGVMAIVMVMTAKKFS